MERWNMRDRLAEAIHEGQLTVEFQPIVKLGSGHIHQLEALARWHDPELGDVPPSVFIEVAEAFGLIDTLGRQIMTQACRQLAAWRRQGLARQTGLSLNLSPLQLRDNDFEQWFCTMLESEGLHPVDVHLEVTETVLVENLATAKAQLGRLSRRGMGISVDDFGVGYSSLSYIRELPIDILKIDRSFIARLDQSVAEREIVRSILGMARKLGLTVVAEGIETGEQAVFLERHGCQLGQGFMFSRPASAEILAKRLRKDRERQG
jgi:EAL domain-containing protein (putative c-di-GMP-specific phosphodiesterase class I)